jgi:hypothetical protein
MSFHPARPSSVLASALATAGIMLTALGCSHVTPLGPDPAGTPGPPRQLGSPIILRVMHGEPATPAGGCPAGSVAVFVPPGSAPMGCYRPVGTPMTITSAAVSPVVVLPQPPPPPGQSAGPAQYGFTVVVPAADVAAVTALITQAHDSRDALGITAAGKLWEAPQVLQAFPGQRLQVAFLRKSEALRLYRLLI